jgi:hypothetical protein
MIKLKTGDSVTWRSQSQGYWKIKEGIIEKIIPAGDNPKTYGYISKDSGLLRNHESYLVKVRNKLYWPIVSRLNKKEEIKVATGYDVSMEIISDFCSYDEESLKNIIYSMIKNWRSKETGLGLSARDIKVKNIF